MKLSVFCAALAIAAASLPAAAASQSGDALHGPIDRSAVRARIETNAARLGLERAPDRAEAFERGDALSLVFPVRAAPNAEQFQVFYIGNYVDHDTVSPGSIEDFACGTRSYDLDSGYDHQGTDIVVGPWEWRVMDLQQAYVVAAAPGVITDKHDGEYDRTCTGVAVAAPANYVTIRQDDGLDAYYWHLAEGTVTALEIGERVEAGDFLGGVGSSGLSVLPHLHFELRDQDDRVVDPYAGACNPGPSLWAHQHDYAAPRVSGLYIHNSQPGRLCGVDTSDLAEAYSPGQMGYFGANLADQTNTDDVLLTITDPEGAVLRQTPVPVHDASFRDSSEQIIRQLIPADAPSGEWRLRLEIEGDVREQPFYVGEPPAGQARLRAAILPSSRSVGSGDRATVFATVLNPSDAEARGCWIAPGSPFDGQIDFVETDPATNAVIGETNRFFALAPGAARSFLITLSSQADAVARSTDIILRYKCHNSDAAPVTFGVNSLLVSIDDADNPDLIAIAAAPGGAGVVALDGDEAASAFAVSTANVGHGGTLTLRPRGAGEADALRLRICETDPATATCLAPAGDTLDRVFAAGETATFSVFVRGLGTAAPFAPARNRVYVEALDGQGVIRGSTSVAVRTN